MSTDRIEALVKNRNLLPRKQRALCDYLLEHADTADLLTVSALAREAKVGEATIFRFIDNLGYQNYADFRKELHEYAISARSSSYWQMDSMLRRPPNASGEDVLAATFEQSIELLHKTLTPENRDAFHRAVELMLSSKRVLLFGLRSSKPLALYFESILCPFYRGIQQLSCDEHFVFDRVSQMDTGDALFLITSWPYTKTSVEAARFCHELGHPIILLTNNLSCSVAKVADVVLMTKTSAEIYTQTPAIALLEALSNEIARRLAPESGQMLERIDRVLHRYQVSEW